MEQIDGAGYGSGGGVALRLFVSIPIDVRAGVQLADRAEALAAGHADVRALDADELHVTWAFLGDVAEEHVTMIARALDDSAAAIPGPTSCVTGISEAFGDGRVLALHVDVELHAMFDSVRDRFLGSMTPWAPDHDRRPWRPHLSLARGSVDGIESMTGASIPSTGWVARELQLHASLPGPSRRQHRLLHSAEFGLPARV